MNSSGLTWELLLLIIGLVWLVFVSFGFILVLTCTSVTLYLWYKAEKFRTLDFKLALHWPELWLGTSLKRFEASSHFGLNLPGDWTWTWLSASAWTFKTRINQNRRTLALQSFFLVSHLLQCVSWGWLPQKKPGRWFRQRGVEARWGPLFLAKATGGLSVHQRGGPMLQI